MSDEPMSPLEEAARNPSNPGLLNEFWFFLRYNKKYWLLPILLVLLLFGLIAMLSTTAAAPFIYTLF
jgi:hypothetical protein